MPQSIPPGLKKEHVVQALNDLDNGIDHRFGAPTGYELVHGGKRPRALQASPASRAAPTTATYYPCGRRANISCWRSRETMSSM